MGGKAELQQLRSILSLSYGPLGAGAMFQPTPGRGHVTCTSTSQRLLPMLMTSSPVGRLVVDSLAAHSQTYRDCGLFAGLLATDLILSGLDLGLPQHQVSLVTSHALSLVTNRLMTKEEEEEKGSGCGGVVRRRLDLSSHHQLSSLLRSLLTSKMATTQLTNSEVDHLTCLLLRCFLVATPRKPGVSFTVGDRVFFHTSSVGRAATESSVEHGLLLDRPTTSCDEWESRVEGGGGGIVTALFDASMAGDLPDEFPRDVELISEERPLADARASNERQNWCAGGQNKGSRETDTKASYERQNLFAGGWNKGQRETEARASNEERENRAGNEGCRVRESSASNERWTGIVSGASRASEGWREEPLAESRKKKIDFEASGDGQREIDFGASSEEWKEVESGVREILDFGASSEEWQEVESGVLKELMRLAVHLVEAGVRFVGCQKVVHPLIKDYWRKKGVYVADRLSSLGLGPVRELTGGQIIGSLSPNLSADSLGRLSSIRHTTVHGKRYVVLEGDSGGGEGEGSHCSLMLCCQTQTAADELRLLCTSALHVLQQCLNSPYVLYGGGCSETLISHFLWEKAAEEHPRDFFTDLRCSERTFRAVMRNVAAGFQRVAVCLEHHGGTVVSDSWSHHCWTFPPDNWGHPGGGGRESKTVGDVTRNRCPFPARGSKISAGVTARDSVSGGKGQCAPADKKQQRASRYSDSERLDATLRGGEGSKERVFHEEDTLEVDEGALRSGKTCGCGCVKLSDLPPTSKWIPLGADNCSVFIPDFVQQQCLEDTDPRDAVLSRPVFPLVCDPFLPKVRAIEVANDLASTVLRISFIH